MTTGLEVLAATAVTEETLGVLFGLEPKEAEPEPELRESILGATVWHPAERLRNNVRYLSLRSWRASTKPVDLAAFKASKETGDLSLATAIGREVSEFVRDLLGVVPGYISNPPGGVSAYRNYTCHFATEIGQAVAHDLSLPYCPRFPARPYSGGSHPKAQERRPPLTILPLSQQGMCLLVDDIATSGLTLEECSKALRERGESVLAIAWLSGVRAAR